MPYPEPVFGRYEIRGVLGEGGFATVYRAWDPGLDREVTLKALSPLLATDPALSRRFQAEARALARLNHIHIVPVYDTGEAGGRPFFTMRLIEGRTLAQVIRPGDGLPLAEFIAILSALASAVDYLHGAGLVHRDIKPSNVMLDRSGSVVLMDLGIARSLDGTQLTRTGVSLGTPEYMAPEQVRGEEVGPEADIYALGVLAYELLAGRPPFVGETVHVYHAHVYESPQPLRDFRQGLPESISVAIDTALEKNPRRRPPTARQFVAAVSTAGPTIVGRTAAKLRGPCGSRARPRTAGRAATGTQLPYSTSHRAWRHLVLIVARAAAIVMVAWGAGLLFQASVARGNPGPIAFIASDDNYEELYVIEATGGTARQISSNRGLGFYFVAQAWWSPDGRRLVAVVQPTAARHEQIVSLAMEGGPETALTEAGDYYIGSVSWSPDSKKIAYDSDRSGTPEIYLMNADATGSKQLTSDQGGNADPSWSPDGGRIAFVHDSEQPGGQEIYTMDAEGGHVAQLSKGLGYVPWDMVWSPDGRWIALESDRGSPPPQGNESQIYVISASNGSFHRITNIPDSINRAPVWSPSGKKLLFYSTRQADGRLAGDIYAVNPDGSGLTRLTNTPADNEQPSWSPDGKIVAFQSDRDGKEGIWVMNADGTDARRLTEGLGNSPVWSSR